MGELRDACRIEYGGCGAGACQPCSPRCASRAWQSLTCGGRITVWALVAVLGLVLVVVAVA